MNLFGCFQKEWYPKMDGENMGKPYEQMDDLGCFPPIFGNIHLYLPFCEQGIGRYILETVGHLKMHEDQQKESHPKVSLMSETFSYKWSEKKLLISRVKFTHLWGL